MAEQVYDFAVVGAGMAGASVAYRLAQKGASVLVLPVDERGWVDQQALWRKLAETGCTELFALQKAALAAVKR